MYLRHCFVESRIEFFKGDIQEICKSHKTITEYAYILHDKDDTAPHYHIYLTLKSGQSPKVISNWFGLQESQVERIKGSKVDALAYLTHSNDSQKFKYQYSPSEVIANFDFQTEIENSKILGDFEKYSYAQQLAYINKLPISEKPTAFSKLEKLWRLHCQCLTLKSDRHIDVIFIDGKGGFGKTYYAKKLLKDMNYDYCVSSSSNDPFQDYMGQKAIILDDLRDRTFEFDDLLKILDNNTASSVRSRFSNKVFNGEIIIVTSTVPLHYWYPSYRSRINDNLKQLYRRFSCYVHVTESEICVYNQIDDEGFPAGCGRIFKNELVNFKKENRQKRDFGDLFSKICENEVIDIMQSEQLKIDK